MAPTQVEATPTPVLIVLYSDRPQCGKSTAAEYLVREHGFVLVKCATILKNMARTFLLGLGYGEAAVESMIEGPLKNEPLDRAYGLTPRQIMQSLGTEFGRESIHKDIWASATAREVRRLLDEGHSVVVDDMRFDNEAEHFAEADPHGSVIQIVRPDAPPSNGHSSDGALSPRYVDHYVYNDQSVEFLYRRMDALVKITRMQKEARVMAERAV